MYEELVSLFTSTVAALDAERVVLIVLSVEALFVVGLVAWIARQTIIDKYRDEQQERLRNYLEKMLFDADSFPIESRNAVINQLSEFPQDLVLSLLVDFTDETADEEKTEFLRQIYRQMGFIAEDLEELREEKWRRQIPALRRLYVMATLQDVKAVENSLHDVRHHIGKILASRLLIHYERFDSLIPLLVSVKIQDRLMEDPLRLLISKLPDPQILALLEMWSEYESPFIQRLVLQRAAQIKLDGTLKYLWLATESDNMELRIGACRAALEYGEGVREILAKLMNDEAWEVRGQAASAIGSAKLRSLIPRLCDATEDPSFWVRQNAAQALSKFDDRGVFELKAIADFSHDSYAADAAEQELDRLERRSS